MNCRLFINKLALARLADWPNRMLLLVLVRLFIWISEIGDSWWCEGIIHYSTTAGNHGDRNRQWQWCQLLTINTKSQKIRSSVLKEGIYVRSCVWRFSLPDRCCRPQWGGGSSGARTTLAYLADCANLINPASYSRDKGAGSVMGSDVEHAKQNIIFSAHRPSTRKLLGYNSSF